MRQELPAHAHHWWVQDGMVTLENKLEISEDSDYHMIYQYLIWIFIKNG